MKIGILLTGHVPDEMQAEHGAFPNMFAKLLDGYGFDFETYAVVDGVFPDSPEVCDGWLVTGSKHGVYEDHPWIPPLENLIREIYAQGVPMIGVCFGHQIMAQALGGKVEKFGGVWGVGNREYTHEDGTTTTLLAMQQDQVVEAPPEATTTATSDYCKFAGFSYKGNAMSIQPHPEFTPEFMEELIKVRAGSLIPNDQADPAMESLDQENDSVRFAEQMATFFRTSAN